LGVVVQERLASFIEANMGGEAMSKMPVEVKVRDGSAFRLLVPDIV
jgi:hypothetical protein